MDAKGLAIFCRNGTLRVVWVPPAELRNLRGLLWTRLALRSHTTMLKCRIHAALRCHGTTLGTPSTGDLFAEKNHLKLSVAICKMPEETRAATRHVWELLREVESHIGEMEARIRQRIGRIGWVRLLTTIAGAREILGTTIYLEIGDMKRFPNPEHLASYAGLVATVHASGGKSYHGPTLPKANHYLLWACAKVANCVAAHRRSLQGYFALDLLRQIESEEMPWQGSGMRM